MYFYLYSFIVIFSIYHKYKALKAEKMLKIRDIKYKEIEDNNSIINLEKEDTNNHSIIDNNELSNTFEEEKLKLDKKIKNNCNLFYKINEEANLIIDKQETMQILKEETIDSENQDSINNKKRVYDIKQVSKDSGEIKFKKSNISLIKHSSNYEKNHENNLNKNINVNISLESLDKNQNDEEYNKVFSSNLTDD